MVPLTCQSLGFNSTLVRLKANGEMHQGRWVRRFNSTLVRLKVFDDPEVETDEFQFHTGSIKRQSSPQSIVSNQRTSFNSTLVRLKGCCGICLVSRLHCFNSTLVRLKGSIRVLYDDYHVSIPHWFD